MVNLDTTKTDKHTKPIAREYKTCSTLKTLRCSKPNSDVILKNHTHLPYNSSDYYHIGINFDISPEYTWNISQNRRINYLIITGYTSCTLLNGTPPTK